MRLKISGFILLAPSSVIAVAAIFAPVSQQPPPTPEKTRITPYIWPERIKNAQVLPVEIGRERLRETMLGYSMSLGVRCTFCHVGQEGSLDFVSDANPRKNITRHMLQMTAHLNREELPAIAGLNKPQVTCYTCHRGAAKPGTAAPLPPKLQ